MKNIFLFIFFVSSTIVGFANDPCDSAMSCTAFVDIDVPFGCEYTLTPEDLLYEGPCLGETYTINVYETLDGSGFSGPINNPVPYQYFATTIHATITRASDGNFCWSEITIGNTIPPFVVVFAIPSTISCQDGIEAIDPPQAFDSCDEGNELTVDFISSEFVCQPGTNDAVDITYLTSDSRGQTKVSIIRVEYIDFCVFADFPDDITVSCPDDLPDPFISVDDVDCARIININISDISIIESCDVTRLYIFEDDATGLLYIHEQQITVDNIPPSFVLNPQSIISYAVFEMNAYDPFLEVYDNCGVKETNINIQFLTQENCNSRDFMVRYHITGIDNCGNESIRTKDVTVERVGNAKVSINGRKDCSDDFIITAETNNLVPPVTYSWASSNPAWVVTPNLSNTALVTPAAGMTTITIVSTDALGCDYTDTKNYNCGSGRREGRSIASIEIGPNPFQDLLQIKNLPGNSKIILLDLKGEMVFQDLNINGLNWSKNLDYLPEGVYFLNIISENDKNIMKIVKVN